MENMQPRAGRSLTVTSTSGLANRLRVLASGMALAEATGRSFEMLWPDDRHTCGAGFHELFDSDLPVVDISEAALAERMADDEGNWLVIDGVFGQLPNLLEVDDPAMCIEFVSWLVDPSLGPDHEPVMRRALDVLNELRPVAEVRERIDHVADTFIRPVIGVHVRRGDFLTARPGVSGNLDAALELAKEQVSEGSKSIFLATDDGAPATLKIAASGPKTVDPNVRSAFREAFGDRVIETQPRSLDRASRAAVEDAVVDLWLLRLTDSVIGTKSSSYSELAAAGRGVPFVDCAGSETPYRRIDQIVATLGLVTPIEWIGRRIYGRDVDAVALVYRATAPLRSVKRRVRRRSS